ncbi:FAD-dependent monooxygenase [Amycolatopsis saalfeldensis]|uniref:4,5-epoxidase n=1 Tax=Amycolatopsis saalfeldensis TaxID=394193 RepID=A0A1H8U5M3_9PSEU|nr:FAD-dependent monooxygenase [Amycolatopsis saalfeldensis]SEO98580.1 4,5-epoxidase [Amycolatopsis saalfeldensis]
MTVLIVGAGPTGLTAACGLLARGVAVRVVDSASRPATSSRALGLQPRGQEVLERAGALGDLRERALDVRATGIHVDGRKVVDVGAALKPGEPRMMWIPQTEIEAQLRARLAALGGRIEWDTPLHGLTQDADQVHAEFDGGERASADWVIGCDGAHSQVRKSAGIGFPGSPLPERFVLADVHAELPGPGAGIGMFLSAKGQFVVMPLPHPDGDLWRLMAPISAEQDGELSEAEILELLRRFAAERAGFTDLRVKSAEWTSMFRFNRRLGDSYRNGRILLAGDAVHIHSPLGGQGLNTGIGDAENLAFKLALVSSGRAGAALLDTYAGERRPVAESVLSATSFGTRIGFSGSSVGRRVFAALAPALGLPPVQRLLLRATSQLDVSYRDGPLAGPAARCLPRHSGPRPGDRVPNIPTRDAEGRRAPLHNQLGTGWAVLTSGSADSHLQEAAKRLGSDDVRALSPETGALPGVFLVRPDAHLAWRGTDAEDLGRWLDTAWLNTALCHQEKSRG